MPELRAVSFNMWVGNKAKEKNLSLLAADANFPHVLALQEARTFNGTIPGYVRHDVDEEGNPESDNCVLLIRKDVEVFKERDLNVKGPHWTGPKHGLDHPPRDFPGLSIEVDGQRWDVVNVHRTWTGNLRVNMGAYRAEHKALVDFADQREDEKPDRPLVLLGDWNSRKSDPRRFGVNQLAQRIGASCHVKGIDGALVRGARVARVRKLRTKHKYGSDGHHPVVITARSH